MIEFKAAWAKGMAGEECVSTLVRDATWALNHDGGIGASRGVDYALAAACEDAETMDAAYDNLGFIIMELQRVQGNMLEEIRREENLKTQADELAAGVRTVKIPALTQHCGTYATNVTLKWICPVCGGPRGEPYKTRSYDGSLSMEVDGWDNPCGHIERYDDIRKAEKELNYP